ncbi:hypothetical protein [Sulfuriroseicoccus oceanibius]|uniref:Uncharacterized protein n=1 Tax=Sulfuriroseicoccus oceanibius TaxID=2707525 RepID=A0A6B3L4T7_9BACT|nr:hypothetical protein [Sulfuriroseicoccus oceanibius]QQL44689.1 hypothetical protein G3M56_012495 [Sulfuriroseicoccus oceanibius]
MNDPSVDEIIIKMMHQERSENEIMEALREAGLIDRFNAYDIHLKIADYRRASDIIPPKPSILSRIMTRAFGLVALAVGILFLAWGLGVIGDPVVRPLFAIFGGGALVLAGTKLTFGSPD